MAMEPDDGNTTERCALKDVLAISDPLAAREISALMLDFSDKLEKSVELVRDTCSVDEWKAYAKVAGGVYIDLFVWVLEPLYKKHPSLKPPNWA